MSPASFGLLVWCLVFTAAIIAFGAYLERDAKKTAQRMDGLELSHADHVARMAILEAEAPMDDELLAPGSLFTEAK